MALDRRQPSPLVLLVVATLLISAHVGQGFFFNSEPKVVQQNQEDESLLDSDDLDAQAAYAPEPLLVRGDSCSATCGDSSQKFNYLPGNVYQYKYEGDLRTFVTKSEFTGIKVIASAHVEVGQGCDFVLKLNDVSLEDFDPMNRMSDQSPSSSYFKRALEANPLTFGFDNGIITSVCPVVADEPWVVNIKRAILSHLQNSMQTLDSSATVEETDISGVCQTSYEVLPQFIKKTKNLNKCTDSYFGKSLLQGVEYRAKSGALPILKGSQECKQEIQSGGHLTSSTCKEEFVFKPLEKKVSGASTTVVTKLTFVSNHRQSYLTDFFGLQRVSSSMLFDHTLSDAEISESFSEAQETLRILQQESSVTPSTPELFNKFAKQLKKLDYEKLQRIQTFARTDKAKSFIYDALPLLETGAAVKTMRDLFQSVDSARQSIWITSFAFIQQPSEETLSEAKHFLELSYKEASLPVSTLLHNFLLLKNSNINSPIVLDILNIFLHNLGSECRFRSSEEELRILRTLKALGNVGFSAHVVNNLKACASNADLPMSLRVAAVEAFRRQSCTSENAQFLEELLNNQELDSELRIVAYIQRSKCFDEEFLRYIKAVLDNEQINQVGSFIWTHLTNLAESQNPLKRDISKLLKDVDTFKRFDLDQNKFSRNNEWSYHHEKSNVGAGVESNLIWSQNSFVPRSLSLNLTVDLFGKSINLIEFGTRIQGVESLLEKTFVKRPQEANSLVVDGGEMFDSKYQKKPDETILGLYIRVFGNELVSEQLNSGLDLDSIKERFNYLNWLMELAKERQVEFTRSFKILDSSLSLPTQIGLPLKLSVEGMATVTLQAKGKFDILRLMSYPSSMEIGGHFKPSSAVVISGEMGIDSKLIKQGIKIVNTLYSKVVVDGKLEVRDGNSFSFDWNTPEDRTDVFSMESRFFVVHRGRSIEKSDENRNAVSELKCLDDSYVLPLGIRPCLEFSFNDLEGVTERDVTSYTPAFFRIYLEKADTHTGYHLSSSVVHSHTDPTDVFRFKIDTPQSRVDRKIFFDFELHRHTGKLDIQFYSPWKTFSLQSQVALAPQAWKADVLITVDNVNRYELKSEIANNSDSQKQQYNYKLEIIVPQTPTIVLQGVLKKNERRVEFQANLANVFPQPVVFNINYNHNPRVNKYELISGLSSHILQLNLRSSAERKHPGYYSWLTKSTLNYKFGNNQQQTAALVVKINDESTSNLKSFQTEGSWEFSEFPHLNVQSFVDLEYSTTTLRSKLELKQNDVRKVLVAQSGILDLHGPRQRINGKLQVELPSKHWDWIAEYDHIQTDAQLLSNTSVTIHGRKEFFVNIGVKNNPRGPLNIAGDVEIGLPKGYSFKVAETVREGVGPMYSFTVDGLFVTPRFTKAGKVEGVYKLVDASKHEWDIKSQIEGFKPIEISGHLNPNPQNIQFKGVAVYDGDTYGMEGKYHFRGNSYERYNAELGAEVFYPSARHSLDVAVTRRSMEFTGQVTVLLKEQVVYKLSTSVTAVSATPSFLVKVEWPNNFFEMSTLGKYETRGWLTTTGDLQGQVALRSSIPGIEEISTSFQANYDSQQTRSTFSVSWSPSKRIVADLLYEGMKLKINASTPFEGYKSLKFKSQTEIQGISLNQIVEVAWESDYVSVTLEGDANSLPNFDGKMVINSGFRGFEPIILHVKNLVNGQNYQSSAELAFSRNQKLALTLTSNNVISHDSVSLEGRIALQTFFHNLENQYITWNHKHNSTGVNSRYEIQVYGERYQLVLDGTTHLRGNNRVVSGDFMIKTPRPGFSNFGINLNYKQSIDAFIGEGRLTGYLEHQRITVQHNLQFLPREALVFKLSIGTPFRGYEKLELDLNNRYDGTSYHAANEIDLGTVGKGTLGGALKFDNTGALDASLEIATTCRHLERASISLKNELIDNRLRTRVEIDYNSGTVLVSGETNIGREKTLDLNINTPWDQMRTFKFASIVNGTGKHLKISADIEHNKVPGKISQSFIYDVRDPKKLLLLQYNLATPYRHLRNIKAELKHHYQRQHHKYLSQGYYEINRERVGLFNQVTFNSWRNFSTATEFTADGRSLHLTTSVFYEESSHLFTATLTTPVPKVERAHFKYGRNGPWRSYSSDISLELNDDKISLDTVFELSQDGNINLSHNLETPFSQVQKVTLVFNHTPRNYVYGSGWTNEGHLELNGVRYTGSSELSWPERKEVVAKVLVNVPSEYGFVLHHKGDARDMDTQLDIKVAGSAISNHLIFKYPDSETIQLKLKIETPYSGFRDFDLSFDHQGSLQKFTTDAVCIVIPGIRNFSFHAEFDESEYKAKSELKFETPVVGLGYNVLSLDHVGPWNNFNTELNSQIGDLRYKNSLNFNYENANDIHLKAMVETPHSGYENFAFEFTISQESDTDKMDAVLTTSIRGYDRFSLRGENRKSTSEVYYLLSLEVPAGTFTHSVVEEGLPSRETFLLVSQSRAWVEGYATHLASETKLETPFRNMERTKAVTKYVYDSNEHRITYRLETSHPNLRFIEESYYYKSDFSSAKFDMVMASSTANLFEWHFSMNQTIGSSELAFNMITPFPALSELKLDATVQETKSQVQALVTSYNLVYTEKFILDVLGGLLVSNEFVVSGRDFSLNNEKRIFVQLQHSNEGQNHFDTSFQMSSPFEQLSELFVQLKYRGRATNLESGLTIDYTSRSTLYRISSNLALGLASVIDHNLLLKFEAPFEKLKQFSLAYGVDFTREEHLATFEVKINDEKKIDIDYKRQTSGDNLITFTLRSPYQMDSSFSGDANSGTATLNWDATRPDSNVRFEFNMKNEQNGQLTERALDLTVITSETTAGFGIGYKLDATSFHHSLRLQWSDDQETPDFSYTVQGSSKSTGWNKHVIEGSVTIITPDINHSVGFTRTVMVNSQYTTRLYSQDHIRNRRIALNSDFIMSLLTLKHVASFEHPDFPKEILSVIEAAVSQNSLQWKQSLRLNDEVFLLEAYLEDALKVENEFEISTGIRFTHPSSNTDVQLKTKVTLAKVVREFETKLLYKLSQSNEMKEFTLSSSYDVVRHNFLIKLETPITTTALKTTGHEIDLDSGVILYDITFTTDDLFYFKSVLDVNLPNKKLDLKLHPNQQKYYQIEGNMKGIGEASLSLNKFENFEENAVKLGWSVDDRNFLVIKNFVKPRFWDEWKVRARQNLEDFSQRLRIVSTKWESLRLELADDVSFKADRFRAAAEPYASIMEEWGSSIRSTYLQYVREFERMYRQNSYHIRDIINGLRAFVEQLDHCFKRSLQITAEAMKALYEKIKVGFRALGVHMDRILEEVATHLRVLEPYIRRTLLKIDSAFKDIENRLKELLYEILSLPEVREFLETLRRLPALTEAEIRERFWAAVDSILSNRCIKSMINKVANSIEKYKSIYSLIYSSDRVTDVINGLRALTTDHYASEKLKDALEYFFKVSQNRWTIWEPETGNYEYQLFVPPRLQEWIDFVLGIDYQGLSGNMGNLFGNVLDELRDMTAFVEEMYSYDWEKVLNLIPPFKSTASLTGTQHFRTFDGRMFQFASNCTHLLARDFVNKSFSAFVNYDSRLRRGHAFKKSITIFTDGRKFDVLPDGRILIDDVKTELPFHYLNTHVIRVGENEVQLVSERGFKLVCDIVHDQCSLTVTGWYHGKLAGLFGTKNFEKADDFLNSEGVQVTDADSFATSWSASSQCGSTNKAVFSHHQFNSDAYESCFSTFNLTDSSFRSCFHHVDPTDFFQMCLNEVPRGDAAGQVMEGVCRISAAYQKECRKHGIQVRMPNYCVKCSFQEATHLEGEMFTVNVDSEAKAADVVLVIQSDFCNKRVFDRIRSLTDTLQKAFVESEDIKLTRFALVSYGGKHVVPRLHTIDGRVFNAFDKVPRANFDSQNPSDKSVDGMAAIQFAAKLPFRTGASKTMIFIPCHSCNGSAGLLYPDVHRMIMQSDIKFHALLPDVIRVKSSSHTKSAFIFGFDDDKVYTKRDVHSELEGDSSLRSFIRMPKDFCAAMTHDTTGIVFSSRQWFDTPNQVQKSFVDVFSRLVARKAQPTQCQECTCLSDNVGSGFTQCVSCVRRSYFTWIRDFLEDDFEESSEESEIQPLPETPVRPVRPDAFTRGPQQTPRPHGRQHNTSGRHQRPNRVSRPPARV